MNKHFIHAKVIHRIAFTHCTRYMFSYLKQECRVNQGLAPDKSFRKTFGKEKVIQTNRNFQRLSNPNQVGIRVVNAIK